MFGTILKATKSSFQKDITFCHSIYVKKVMKLLAFIFEQPSYFGLYLRGVMSAVTGIYLFRLLLNIIFFVLRSFLP